MVVAIGTFEFHFPELHSLKEKRQVLRSLLDRVKAKFNASIAEVEYNDLWQRSVIGVSMVANEKVHLEQMAGKIEEILQDHEQAQLIERYWEYL
ncbi:MAG: DUF503 domain-containing protein [Candidatus Riflebacteria bacterium]|nr:DUF503 domain-containing protein [Candidatus Riflebacteria bacterium]